MVGLLVVGAIAILITASYGPLASSGPPLYSDEYLRAKNYFKRRGAAFEFTYIKNSEYLFDLDLSGCHIADDDLLQLAHIGTLTRLSLKATRISDPGMVHLGHQDGLEVLNLSDTAVTNEGLNLLHKLSHLKTLDVTGTRVTAQGIRDLQDAIPECNVQWP